MLRSRPARTAAAAAASLSLTFIASCGSPSTPGGDATSTGATTALAGAGLDAVSATGPVDRKTAPKVTFATTPVRTTTVTRKVLTKGSGPAATKADTVMVRVQIYNGTTGKLVDDGFVKGRAAEGYRLGRKDLIAGFTEGLVGAQKGARIAFTIPPDKGFGDAGNEALKISGTDTIVVIADVASIHTGLTKIEGSQAPSPAGLPTVTFPSGPTKAPKITIPKAKAPTTTKAVTLIQGTGPVVRKGQTLAAQYQGVLWKDGSVFDSSWERGESADFPIGVGAVIPGWDKTLVGQKVGSRVLLVIPPKDGYGAEGRKPKISGTDTLVFVVDILDAY